MRIRLFATQAGKAVAQASIVREGLGQQSAVRDVYAGDVTQWTGQGAPGGVGVRHDDRAVLQPVAARRADAARR